MKRVWNLYRVSTKGQVNPDEDIPMQKNACREFIKKQNDWVLKNELYERGVSGWKNTTDQRDELMKIKAAAENNEFDVLLVFMYDRLGRREDESPLVVQFLIEHGVEVWSVKEGQSKIEDHTDLLVNYIRFWQSSGESKKTSIRVKEILEQMNQEAKYTGSNPPYGYEVYDTGEKHWKYDKNIKDMKINPVESEVVKLIFNLYVNSGYGVGRITQYLNENGYKPRKSNSWRLNTILSILKNPIYTGRKRFNVKDKKDSRKNLPPSEHLLSKQREDWIIIDDVIFNEVQKTLENRSLKQKKTVRKGKLLLNGIAKCGYCNKLLYSDSGSNSYKLKDGTVKRRKLHRYRCISHRQTTIPHERYIFTSKKYEDEVISIIKDKLLTLKLESDIYEKKLKYRNEAKEKFKNEISNIIKQISTNEKELDVLNNEIVKSLTGSSKFKPEQLSAAIESLEVKMKDLKDIKEVKEKEYHTFILELERDENLLDDIDDLMLKLDNAPHDQKKVLISRIVEEIKFYKNKIDVNFKLNL